MLRQARRGTRRDNYDGETERETKKREKRGGRRTGPTLLLSLTLPGCNIMNIILKRPPRTTTPHSTFPAAFFFITGTTDGQGAGSTGLLGGVEVLGQGDG